MPQLPPPIAFRAGLTAWFIRLAEISKPPAEPVRT